MNNPYLYVVLNGELNMSAGKAAAQTAHAVASLHHYYGLHEFSKEVQRTVIVLEAKNQAQLLNLEDYLFKLDIPAASYTDEGVNEVDPYSVTALAVGPIDSVDEWQREVLSMFPLYGSKKRKKWYHL